VFHPQRDKNKNAFKKIINLSNGIRETVNKIDGNIGKIQNDILSDVGENVNDIKDQLVTGFDPYPIPSYEGGTKPDLPLPSWPCVQQNLDCRTEDGSNILNQTTINSFLLPYIQDYQCSEFCRQTEGCEFWTIERIQSFFVNCFALSSCAEIKRVGFRSGPVDCIYPEYKGFCPFCPWERPFCFGHCSYTECIGECIPEYISNDEVCTDLQAKAQYGDCADNCHEESDDCKQCVADKTSFYNCGGIYASCGIIDLGRCVFAARKAYLECKNAGSHLEILKCIAEKVTSNSACKNCFCKAVCKFFPKEFCDLCSMNEDFGFKTAFPPIRNQADSHLTFPVTITRIVYQDAINCPAIIEPIKLSPNECASAVTRGECLIASIEAINSDTSTPCIKFSSETGSSESRFVIKLKGVNGCEVHQQENAC